MVVEGVGRLFQLGLGGAAADAHPVEQTPDQADARVLGEFRIVGKVELFGDGKGEIARGQHLDLALHRLLVERLQLVAALIASPAA